jgi:hypothetical protein
MSTTSSHQRRAKNIFVIRDRDDDQNGRVMRARNAPPHHLVDALNVIFSLNMDKKVH